MESQIVVCDSRDPHFWAGPEHLNMAGSAPWGCTGDEGRPLNPRKTSLNGKPPGKGLVHNPEGFMNKKRWPIWPRCPISYGTLQSQAESAWGT